MMKRLAMAFGLGAAMPLLVALWLGGETIAQGGMRLHSLEQGFALAMRHHQWEATVAPEEIEPEVVAKVESAPVGKPRNKRAR